MHLGSNIGYCAFRKQYRLLCMHLGSNIGYCAFRNQYSQLVVPDYDTQCIRKTCTASSGGRGGGGGYHSM